MLRLVPTPQAVEFVALLRRHEVISYNDKNPIVTRAETTYRLLEEIASKEEIKNIFLDIDEIKKTPCIIIDDAAYTYIVGGKSNAATVHSENNKFKKDIEDILNIKRNILLNSNNFILIRSVDGDFFNCEIAHEATHIFHKSKNKPTYLRQTSDYINNTEEHEAISNEMYFYKILNKNSNFNSYFLEKTKNIKFSCNKNYINLLENLWG